MSAPLERAIQQTWPIHKWGDQRVLVAISGGADSVALLHALLKVSPSPSLISAAHFNHGWRGAESDGDEHFVAELCSRLGVELHLGHNRAAEEGGLAKSEENARDARYQFLIRTAYRVGARYVCTAHTASDRVETMLHNLFRGTGLAGVCAPQLSRLLHDELLLIRPLLNAHRQEILDYLSHLGQPYRNDSSNLDESFKRNFIRHSLLPLIRENYGEQVDQRLAAFASIAEETLESQRAAAHDYLNQVEQRCDLPTSDNRKPAEQKSFAIPHVAQLPAHWPIVHQALILAWQSRTWPLQSMSREHWQCIRTLWESSTSEVPAPNEVIAQLPNNLELRRSGTWIVIQPTAPRHSTPAD